MPNLRLGKVLEKRLLVSAGIVVRELEQEFNESKLPIPFNTTERYEEARRMQEIIEKYSSPRIISQEDATALYNFILKHHQRAGISEDGISESRSLIGEYFGSDILKQIKEDRNAITRHTNNFHSLDYKPIKGASKAVDRYIRYSK